MTLTLDKRPKYRYAVLSTRKDSTNVELESSAESEGYAERLLSCYRTWGLLDTNYYLVDWQTQKVLAKHETYQDDCTRILDHV